MENQIERSQEQKELETYIKNKAKAEAESLKVQEQLRNSFK